MKNDLILDVDPEACPPARRYDPHEYVAGSPLLLPFHHIAGGRWRAQPFTPITPTGLAIWGTSTTAEVKAIWFNGCNRFFAGEGAVPARWFAYGHNYEQLARLIARRREPPAWLVWPTLTPVDALEIVLADRGVELTPDHGISLCMWGLGLLR